MSTPTFARFLKSRSAMLSSTTGPTAFSAAVCVSAAVTSIAARGTAREAR
jgi:hypothetical protein